MRPAQALHAMGLHQPLITAIRLHPGNLAVKTGNDLRMLRVLQADQDMQAVFAQRCGQKLHRIAHPHRLARQVIARHILILHGQPHPLRRQPPLILPDAILPIWRESRGYPRSICLLCLHLCLELLVTGGAQIDGAFVDRFLETHSGSRQAE